MYEALSVGGAKYFVTLIDKASRHGSVCHVKKKGEAAELLKRHVRWVERQTACRVKKDFLDEGKENIKATKELEADVIEVCVTTSDTREESGCAEQMNCTNKNAIRTTLLPSSAPASLQAEFMYAVCDARYRVVRAGHSRT